MYFKYAPFKIIRNNVTTKKGETFSVATTDTEIFDTSTNKTTEISIKMTFENNIFTRQRTLIIPDHNPLKRLHQSHQRNQVNLLILSCITKICYFKVL